MPDIMDGFKLTDKMLEKLVPLEPYRVIPKVPEGVRVKIELGCGRRKVDPESIGIDIEEHPGVDLVHNLVKGIPFLNDSVDYIFSRDFVEHLPNPIFIMQEMWRVLKNNGITDIIVPSTDGRGAFQDATHISYWNENSFGYWCDSSDWADNYRGIALFRKGFVRTIGLNPDGSVTEDSSNPVKHVEALLYAIKNEGWIKEYGDRKQKLRIKTWGEDTAISRIISNDRLERACYIETDIHGCPIK